MNKRSLEINDLFFKLKNLYAYFRDKDYFKEKLGITSYHLPDEAKYKVAIALNLQVFPLSDWLDQQITDDNIFDTIEFLYEHVSKPGPSIPMITSTGYGYEDYESYDEVVAKSELRDQVNIFICDYKDGFDLTESGEILALGTDGLETILNAKIIEYDPENIDKKVASAIRKWRNRHLDFEQRKQAIVDLAGVFEWLKKTGELKKVLNKKDEDALFIIANKFSLRHHDPDQRSNYDTKIWYPWMFHFYLATYHAMIRLIKRDEEAQASK